VCLLLRIYLLIYIRLPCRCAHVHGNCLFTHPLITLLALTGSRSQTGSKKAWWHLPATASIPAPIRLIWLPFVVTEIWYYRDGVLKLVLGVSLFVLVFPTCCLAPAITPCASDFEFSFSSSSLYSLFTLAATITPHTNTPQPHITYHTITTTYRPIALRRVFRQRPPRPGALGNPNWSRCRRHGEARVYGHVRDI